MLHSPQALSALLWAQRSETQRLTPFPSRRSLFGFGLVYTYYICTDTPVHCELANDVSLTQVALGMRSLRFVVLVFSGAHFQR